MLEKNHPQQAWTEHSGPRGETYDWRWMLRALLRRPLPVLLAPALCVALAAIYVVLRPANYTATTTLNITNLRLSSNGQDTFFAEAQFEPTFLETQIQIVASEPVARAVIDKLNLAEQNGGDVERALKAFRNSLSLQRVGQSNLVAIAYTARDPQQAATIANEVAAAYIAKLHANREDAVKSASSWLRDRLREVGPKAQVVSAATPPIDKSDSRGILIIAAAGVAGAAAGMVLALILAFLDRRIQEPEQALTATGAECLGVVPQLSPKASAKVAMGAIGAGQFDFGNAAAILSQVDAQPFSPIWQALRHVGVASEAPATSSRMRRLAVTSALAGEGKTTIAANFALMAAGGGKRVLLVDAQPYDPALSRALAPSSKKGLGTLLAGGDGDLASHVLEDPRSGVHFLPFGKPDGQAGSAQRLWSQSMDRLFDQATGYDLVIFDMPPLLATGDLRAAAAHVDGFLLVVEWNKVSTDELRAALALAAPVRDRLVGTILNKATPGAAQRLLSPEASILARQSLFATEAGQNRPS
jgi:Mrp family chromosome partitioning ATPase/capsular polysaccharide biosynthesis protein